MLEIDGDAFQYSVDDADMELFEGYSGRFMYGKTCPGFTFEGIPQLLNWATRLHSYIDEDTVQSLVDRVRTDSMGLDTIAYFPDVELVYGGMEEDE